LGILVAVALIVVSSNFGRATSFDRTSSMPSDGLISVPSRVSARETLNRLLAALATRKLTVFAHVDHAAGAVSIGLSLRPTDVVIFGNAKGGTALMQDHQSAGIDLPLKALVWEDAEGKVWLTYNDPAWIADRHDLGAASAAAVKAMSELLGAIAQETTQ
jgi:uncharacterized protein (DUF302 family)